MRYTVFDYCMSVFQATPRQNIINSGPSSKQEWNWLQFCTNMSLPTHTGKPILYLNTCRCIHVSGCPELRTAFSHANGSHERNGVWLASGHEINYLNKFTLYQVCDPAVHRVIDSVAEQSRLWINNDCSHTEHPSQNELLECDNYFKDNWSVAHICASSTHSSVTIICTHLHALCRKTHLTKHHSCLTRKDWLGSKYKLPNIHVPTFIMDGYT